MAPRAGARKTYASQPSQSQRPSQTQRGRQPSDEPDEDVSDAGDEPMNEDGDDNMRRMSNDLVRLALFNEHRRMPLRREEINKKVMKGNSRAFNHVFQLANAKLKDTFGYEMAEVMSRGELEQLELQDKDGEPSATQGGKKKAPAKGQKSYILRSTLSAALIDAASIVSNSLVREEIMANANPDDDEDLKETPSHGTLFDWNRSDQLGPMGFLHVMLALIMVNGRQLTDYEFRKHLKSFNMDMNYEIEVERQTTKTVKLNALLTTWLKQGYLDKLELSANGMPLPTQGKRARNADDEGVRSTWRWGPRAHSEIGEQALAEFVAEFMVERSNAEPDNDDDSEDGQGAGPSQQRRNRNREKRAPAGNKETKEKMLDGIMKAAGGALYPLH